jgi:hypothetical protein
MTISRERTISHDNGRYYHCISRCARRAYLCGEDQETGRNYEHRRKWIVDQLMILAEVFAIEVCAYAVNNSQTHILVKINQEKAMSWDSDEVISRWTSLYKLSPIVARFVGGFELSKAEKTIVTGDIEKWRRRLNDISWFICHLNKTIAQKANEEDNSSRRFWEVVEVYQMFNV